MTTKPGTTMDPAERIRIACAISSSVLLCWEELVSENTALSKDIFIILLIFLYVEDDLGHSVSVSDLENMLCDKLNRTPPTVRAHMSFAEDKKLIERVRHASDKRKKLIKPTPLLVARLDAYARALITEVEALLPAVDRRTAAAVNGEAARGARDTGAVPSVGEQDA